MYRRARSDIPVIIYQIDRTGADNTPELLAAAAGPSVWSSPGDISKAIELAKSRRSAIYHLHDEAALSTGETDGEIRSAAVGLLRDVERLRLEGGRLIWSRSDRPGRDAAEAPLAELRAGLAQLATVQHLPSWAALEALGDARGPGRVVVFPHGGYVPHCRVWPGPRARKRLGIADETFVFMLFAGFSELSSDDLTAVRHALGALEASAHLIVAGAENLPDAVPSEHVTVIGETGGPADRLMPFAAADAVVIPRTSGYSSRTAVLARSSGRGVIGPETPSLRGVVENEYSGSLFPPDESDGLRRLMARAARQGRQVWAARGGAAARAATAQGWDVVGPMWRDLYRSISDEAHFRMSEAAAIDVG